jgi:hypothetical protein
MANGGAKKTTIFISHTHTDAELAHAINGLIEGAFGGAIETHYSTKSEGAGGPRPGEDWFEWIGNEVRQSTAAIILLTPSSAQKTWVLWEAGAVAGAAISVESGQHRQVWPIIYRLSKTDIPGPLQRKQVINGEDATSVESFLTELLSVFPETDKRQMVKAIKSFGPVIDKYRARVKEALSRQPLPVTEAAIQEWLERIAKFRQTHRTADLDQLRDWINTSFGYDNTRKAPALDLRIHRQLGELYAKGKWSERAAEQFELARWLAPRDLYILRFLGKAYLDQNRDEEVGKIIRDIEEFDPQAVKRDIETAALKARWQSEFRTLEEAEQTLSAASEANPHDHYLRDNLAQTKAQLNKAGEGRAIYAKLFDEIDALESKEQTVWTRATGLTAAIALENGRGEEYRQAILAFRPDASQRESIERGLRKVYEAFKIKAKFAVLDLALDGTTSKPARTRARSKGK